MPSVQHTCHGLLQVSKYVLENQVAVIIASDYGAGWSSSAAVEHREALMFDQVLVQNLLNKDHEAFIARVKYLTGKDHTDLTHPVELVVHWIPSGVSFEICEHAGMERVRIFNQADYTVA